MAIHVDNFAGLLVALEHASRNDPPILLETVKSSVRSTMFLAARDISSRAMKYDKRRLTANYRDTLCFFFLPRYPKSPKSLLGCPKYLTSIP